MCPSQMLDPCPQPIWIRPTASATQPCGSWVGRTGDTCGQSICVNVFFDLGFVAGELNIFDLPLILQVVR